MLYFSSTGELRLSCLSIIVPVCDILAQMLASSSSIKIVDLGDCMLLSKGLSSILNALCDGSSVTYLNLKGNSISGSVVEQLGQVFLRNNTLKILHLEWNSLGSNVESFSAFCDGLLKNHNIEELDLRYNQISPHCAEALSKVLKYNKSLKTLDLAWNTLGLHGGQMILDGMHENKAITRLNLRGNCLPDELLESIGKCTCENKRRKLISKESITKGIEVAKVYVSKENLRPVSLSDSDNTLQKKTKCLRKKVRKKDRSKTLQPAAGDNAVGHSLFSDSDESSLSKNLIESREMLSSPKIPIQALINDQNSKMAEVNCKINELNQILQDRASTIDHLTNEIASKEVEITEAKSQIITLQQEIRRLEEEKEIFTLDKAKEISELQRIHAEAEENWEKSKKELEDSYNKTLSLKKEVEATVRRYERDIHKSSVEVLAIKEKLLSTTQAYEDLISRGESKASTVKKYITNHLLMFYKIFIPR